MSAFRGEIKTSQAAAFDDARERLHEGRYSSREEFDADVAAAPGVAALLPHCRVHLTEEQKDMIAEADPYAALIFLKRTTKPRPEIVP